MPSWGEILEEINQTIPEKGFPDFDTVRRKYLTQLAERTGRSTVLYASNWMSGSMPGQAISVVLGDMQGLMEVFHELPGPNLDLILHSPGGQAEATERLVRYMRSKFTHVRVFVPLAAMSAATMWAMAADEIVMGKHSQLGPIDPQITTPNGVTLPAGALLDQFQQASDELAEKPERISGWLPILQQYPPGLLNFCVNATELAQQLVGQWLQEYMFAGDGDGEGKAKAIASWLSDDKAHLSHSRPLTREQLQERGVKVSYLEDDQALQDAVLSVFHATMHTWNGGAAKIIENHKGRAFVQHGGQQVMLMPGPAPAQMPPQGLIPAQGPFLVSPDQLSGN
jgi:hypothetical protein